MIPTDPIEQSLVAHLEQLRELERQAKTAAQRA